MAHTRIEPHVQGVGDFFVLLRFVAEKLLGVEFEPGFDALLFDAQRNFLDQTRGLGMQCLGFLVDE